MHYTIRPVNFGDFAALMDIELAAFGEHGYCGYFVKMIPHLFPHSCLLAEVDGHAVGYSLGAPDGGDVTTAWILTAAVKPDFQGHGLGKSLTCELMRVMEARGARTFLLTVEPDNPARELYRRLGFVEVKYEADCYGQGQHRYYMQRKVSL